MKENDINRINGDLNSGKGICLTVLGARGSVPVHGERFHEYGGATTCFLIEAGEQAVFVDAGTGIIAADAEMVAGKEISILLTHPHIDHLAGLPFFAPLSEKERRISVYGTQRGGSSLREQVDALYRPPYWPLGLSAYPSDIEYHTIRYQTISNSDRSEASAETPMLRLGHMEIDGFEVPHPGGCTAYRIRSAGRSIVIATDAELPFPGGRSDAAGQPPDEGADTFDADGFLAFIRGADLMLCDSQYTDAEYAVKKGYGHSTPSVAFAWKEAAGVKELLLVHHDPTHDDEFLDAWERQIGRPDVHFARRGDRRRLI
ncbi:MAG: MBL fold metallo-hydrolase [Lachnospiraceae bacterium]|nr:MBL fold metallo-hydrolase [Lachnospiraceae bacterium]